MGSVSIGSQGKSGESLDSLYVVCIGLYCNPFMDLTFLDDTPPALRINSTLFEGEFACPGEIYYFECVVLVSYDLVWLSDEYIGGDGDYLKVSKSDIRDDPKTSQKNAQTAASLKEVDMQNHTLHLRSTLRVTVSLSEVNQSHTVICLNPATGMNHSVTIVMAGM